MMMVNKATNQSKKGVRNLNPEHFYLFINFPALEAAGKFAFVKGYNLRMIFGAN